MRSSSSTTTTASRHCGNMAPRPSPRQALASPLRATAARCSLKKGILTLEPSKWSLQAGPLAPWSKPMLLLLPHPHAAAYTAYAANSPTSTSSSSARYLPPRAPTDDPSRLRVAVLTGWLGSGKTTTLTRWLEAAAAEREDASDGEGEGGGGGEGKAKRAPPRVRLIINDVGASSIDAAVLSKGASTAATAVVPPASLVALTAGCACCSLQAELVEAVADAAADARAFASSSSPSAASLLPDSWLFIECTGLALPSPVANAVAEGVRRAGHGGGGGSGDEKGSEEEEDADEDPLAEESLEAVVAVVDASTFAAGLAGAFDIGDDDEEEEEDFEEEEFEEFDEQGKPLRGDGEGFAPRDFAEDEGPFEELAGVVSPEGSVADLLASQVEAADVVLLNKADAVSLEALEEARALVEALNPGARIVAAVRGDVPPSSLLGSAAAAAAAAAAAVASPEEAGGSQRRRRRRGVAGWAAALAAAAAARRKGGKKHEKKEEEEEKKESHHDSHGSHGSHDHHHHGADDERSLHSSAHGISTFVFHSTRPFLPQRLLAALEDEGSGEDGEKSGKGDSGGPWKGVVRSKGFFWLATRPKVAGLWQAAGGSWAGDPSHLWERSGKQQQQQQQQLQEASSSSPSSSSSSSCSSSSSSSPPQQELVFIGNRSMSEERVREALEGALLTDEEMLGGEESWAAFEDELPPWEQEG